MTRPLPPDPDSRFRGEVVRTLRSVLREPDEFVPLHAPEFAGEEWALVKDCLDAGWVSSVGKYVDRFEVEVARACHAEHCVAVVNGTAALHVALLVAGVRPGDEVLIPALTFVATANAVRHAGAIPHLVDSAFDTLGMDPVALERHLGDVADHSGSDVVNRRTSRRIAAVLPMHVFGHPVDMDGLARVAAAHGLPVIEDAAEALGSDYHGRRCGSLGRLGTLSFNGNKIVTTGGGGAIVTDDPELAAHARHLTTTAKAPHRWAFVHDEVAFNYRLPNLNAALGCAQLAQLEERLKRKRHLAQRYIDGCAGQGGVKVFTEPANCRSNYWLNTLVLDRDHAGERDALLDALNDAGLMCRPVWTLMHRLPMYAHTPRADLSVAEELEARLINVPSSAALGGSA
jgi:perosamine synthetase